MSSNFAKRPGNEPVAIIGTGCRFPGGANSPSKLWELLRNPRDVSKDMLSAGRFDHRGFYHPDPDFPGHTNVRRSYFLEEDITNFDPRFFNLQIAEAEAMDPQTRILLETVYEGLETAGQTLEGLRGSDTGVWLGMMYHDYDNQQARDLQSIPPYHGTGASRSMASNRVSYFFDWHGPSLTIDTACSSSLVALHQAVQSLRSGEVSVAVVAGTNLLVGPEPFIYESNLKMLSPDGQSRMWGDDANGYARGDGVAAVVVKTLSQALADGDHIECVVRETGVNQDGRSPGITMPTVKAQVALIRDVYHRAGLDLASPADRCQYVEAHGTGTPAGDPIEAEAIHTAFYEGINVSQVQPIVVGSNKTVIGHTESTAGLAAVIKVAQAMKHGQIPPNGNRILDGKVLDFKINPRVEPWCKNLRIASELTPWPEQSPGQPRRASINSFGYGGTNGHVILETPPDVCHVETGNTEVVRSFVFSAQSTNSLMASLEAHARYLSENPDTNLADLAWTLQSRRSRLPLRAAIPATSMEMLRSSLESISSSSPDQLRLDQRLKLTSSASRNNERASKLLGVFTGQGAQWARMGAQLIEVSPLASNVLSQLDAELASLPNQEDRPDWTLRNELLADQSKSRVGEAAIAQPLCTAVQVILVDLLRAAGVEFAAVVGHSSGEIGAVYWAGQISASDAIRVAYYRGLHSTRLAGGLDGIQGAMLAVTTSMEDASEVCGDEAFRGRITVAACNSPHSVTLSGDSDAVEEIAALFEDEGKTARRLRVDKAYHSHHMTPCAQPYLNSMLSFKAGLPETEVDSRCVWVSSVKVQPVTTSAVDVSYWVDNLLSPVLFQQAVERAVEEVGPFDGMVEVGPHPALKGPVRQILDGLEHAVVPYTGVLERGKEACLSVSTALGYLWTQLDSPSVNFYQYETALIGSQSPRPQFLPGLPLYQWSHSQYWHESHASRRLRFRARPVHPLLGDEAVDSSSERLSWKAMLRAQDIPWVQDHRIQEQSVFPAAGYVVTALEAAPFLSGDRPIRLIEIEDLTIQRAMIFDKETLEVRFSIDGITRSSQDGTVTGRFTYQNYATNGEAELIASGRLHIALGEPSQEMLPASKPNPGIAMVEVATQGFYEWLSDIGYGYTGPFRALSKLQRRLGTSVGMIDTALATYNEGNHCMSVHPGMLDAAIQSVILAYSYPMDGRLSSLHLPTRISKIRVNPALCGREWGDEPVPFIASIPDNGIDTNSLSAGFRGDVEIHRRDGASCVVQIEGLQVVPFSEPTASDDRTMFYETCWIKSDPAADINGPLTATQDERQLVEILERGHYYCLRQLEKGVPVHPTGGANPSDAAYLRWVADTHRKVKEGNHRYGKPSWENDTWEDIKLLTEPYSNRPEVKAMHIVGKEMPRAIRGETSMIEHLTADGLLDDYFSRAMEMEPVAVLADVVQQITRRYPRANIIDVSAGTGGATGRILQSIGSEFGTFTLTDTTAEGLDEVKLRLGSYHDQMTFRVLDLEQDPSGQGFDTRSFDIVIAPHVLHKTKSLDKTLQRVRSLLRPGGFLVFYEITNSDLIRVPALLGCLPGWWQGADDDRVLSPGVDESKWDTLLRRTGFSGVDTMTETDDRLAFPYSVMVSQAVDDWVEFVRQPLMASSSVPSNAMVENLVIVGGANLHTSRLIDGVRKLVKPFCKSAITTVERIEDLGDEQIDASSTVLVLQDLDNPVFSGMTADRMEKFKRLLASGRTLVWATHNRLVDNPYATMALGFIRSLVWETPELCYQFFDFNGMSPSKFDAHALTESLLRAQAGGSVHSPPRHKALWSVESEISIDSDGCTWIPRLEPSREANGRYNSALRPITQMGTRGQGNAVELCRKGGRGDYTLHALNQHSEPGTSSKLDMSSLYAVRTEFGDLFVVSGTCEATGVKYLGLTSSITSPTNTEITSTVKIPDTLAQLPLITEAMTQTLLRCIESQLPADGAIIVHGAPPKLATALAGSPSARRITFTTSSRKDAERYGWTHLPPYSRKGQVQALLPVGVSILIDLSAETPETSELGNSVARSVQVLAKSSLLTAEASRRMTGRQQAVDILQAIVDSAVNEGFPDNTDDLSIDQIPIDRLVGGNSNADAGRSPLTIVDWRGVEPAPVTIQPVSVRLRDDRTYWLLGLSKDLGLSLADWMIHNGARHIAISSRNPNINKAWLENAAHHGATIAVIACDITEYDSLSEAHSKIVETMPPIAGVAQGTMILRDMLIQDMTLEDLTQVLRPKVDGSINLDRVLRNTELDFFVFFSSAASVMGNVGQASYSAANCFMGGLARQRRSRGLAASVMDLGAVLGIGYVAREFTDGFDRMAGKGLVPISETDVHCQFAEAIKASPATAGEDTVWHITSGLKASPPDVPDRPLWYNIPQFVHMTLRDAGSSSTADASNEGVVSIKQQLAEAKTKEDVQTVTTDNLLREMASMLHVGDDYALTPAVRTDELGLDSLVAVRIRSWILSQFQVNVPALKIIKGASLQELIDQILAEIPAELTPGLSDAPPSADHGEAVTTAASTSSPSETKHTPAASSSDGEGSSTDDTEFTMVSPPETKELNIERFGSLSYTQSAFMFVHELLEDKATLNSTVLLQLKGRIRVQDLERAVQHVSYRHEALRTCFVTRDGVRLQGVLKEPTSGLTHQRVSTEADVWRAYEESKRTAFDLKQGHTTRVSLLSTSPENHYLVLATHHIVFDRSSTDIAISELDRIYTKDTAELNSPLQYIDYANRLHEENISGRYADAIGYWRREFDSIPEPLPLRRSPVTERRPLEKYSTRTGLPECLIRIDDKLTAQIRQVARKYRSTPFHFHLAAFKVLLLRWLGVEDICIGVADGSRRDEREWTAIGPFLNMLPVRMKAQASQTFANAITESRQKSHDALSNAIPLEILLTELKVSRQATHPPLAQAFINYAETSVESKRRLLECDAELLDEEQAEIPYDIALTIVTNRGANGTADTKIVMNLQNSLYDANAARALAAGYEDILHEFVQRPGDAIQDEWKFRQTAVSKAITVGRGPDFSTNWPDTVVHRIDSLLPSVGERIAVTDGYGSSVIYKNLAHQVNAIASSLLQYGVIAGSRVGVYQDPTAFWVASVIAILKIGAVYVPLDAATPPARLALMVKDCNPAAVLVNTSTLSKVFELKCQCPVLDASKAAETSTNLIPTTVPEKSPAMILYTSGSTGTPKGVVLTHQSLRHEFEHCQAVYGLTPDDVVLQQSAWSFDLSVTQLFLALTVGARLHIASHTLRADGQAMAELIRNEGVTTTYATPTEYKSWLQDAYIGIVKQSPWKLALVAGEPVTVPLLERFNRLARPDQLRLFNVYGPTETTCGSTKTQLDYGRPEQYADGVPVGRASANECFYILDHTQNVQPLGLAGEIAIGGVGVAKEYLNNPDQTNSSFVKDSIASPEYVDRGWTTMYRTGDFGYLKDDGTLVLQGRLGGDTEVKLNGVRIDLRDVEQTILKASNGQIADVAACVRTKEEVKYMVAYCVLSPSLIDAAGLILQPLLESLPLPPAMRPSALITVKALPRTTAAKLDRRALQQLEIPQMPQGTMRTSASSLSEDEANLLRLWQSVLPGEVARLVEIGPDSDFFSVGGTSMLLVQLQAKLAEAFYVPVTLLDLFRASTLRGMARVLQPALRSGSDDADMRIGAQTQLIDWDKETSVSIEPLLDDSRSAPPRSPPRVVVLTGATGFLGQHILRGLLEQSHVEKIICIANRNLTEERKKSLFRSPRVECLEGDLAAPNLGMTQSQIDRIFKSEADAVIHNGADVSHLKTYASLRAPNVDSTKVLARLCLPKRVPLHYVSTSGVTMYTTSNAFPEVSTRKFPPPRDGTYGYISSKWASEVYLENVSSKHNLPVTIHRPSSIIRPDMNEESPAADVLQNMLAFSRRIATVPLAASLKGYIDLVRPETVTDKLLLAVTAPSPSRSGGIVYIHESGDIEMEVEKIPDHLSKELGKPVEQVPLDEWVRRAEKAGLSAAMAAVFRGLEDESLNFPRMLRSQ
ncbi:beta-ketoacyl synthase domain-containing protein [Aspergillus unguis]